MSDELPSRQEDDSHPSVPPVIPFEASVAVAPMTTTTEPSIGAALALTGIYVGLLIGLQVATLVVFMMAHHPSTNSWITNAQMIAAFVLTMALTRRIARCSWRSLMPRTPAPVAAIPGAVLLSLGCWLIAVEIGTVTELLLPIPEAIAREFEQLFRGSDPVASLVLLTLLPPVIEETLCRGLVLGAMLRKWRWGLALAVSALVFGAIHLNPWQFFYATWIGLVIGWVYWRTRSLGLCVVMHAVNNGLSWLAMRWQPDLAGLNRESYTEPPSHVPPLLLLAAGGLLVAGAALVWRATHSQDQQNQDAVLRNL